MPDWISEAYADNLGWDVLRRLTNASPRLGGSTGEKEAAEIVHSTFEELGLDNVRTEPFDMVGWSRGSSSVDLPGDDRSFPCIALPRSPSDETAGELCDVGYGLPEDFGETDVEGKIVMAAANVQSYYDRFIHRREKYYYAVEHGAAGFLFRNHIDGQLPPTGSIGTEDVPIGEIPAVGVSKETGLELARRYEGETVSVDVEATIGDATSQNVHAEVGPGTDEQILVTSHVDGHDIATGALDNGAGTAIVVEIAKALKAREDELDTKVQLVAFGAEELMLLGSEYLVGEIDLDTVKAVVNNDGSGRARDLKVITHGFDIFEDVLGEASEQCDAPIEILPTLNPNSDHWPFVSRGIPGCQTKSDTGSRDRGWGHTQADTLDKVDSRDIRHHAILLTEAIVELADEDCEARRRSVDSIESQLDAENKLEGMCVIGDWP
jgi:Zn-dependent M28 family amino/carboxypeptidase